MLQEITQSIETASLGWTNLRDRHSAPVLKLTVLESSLLYIMLLWHEDWLGEAYLYFRLSQGEVASLTSG